jgi:hypothetical protein
MRSGNRKPDQNQPIDRDHRVRTLTDPAAGLAGHNLMVADQYQHKHDDDRGEDQAHDDHPDAKDAGQVQTGYASFGASFLFELGHAWLRRRPRWHWHAPLRAPSSNPSPAVGDGPPRILHRSLPAERLPSPQASNIVESKILVRTA